MTGSNGSAPAQPERFLWGVGHLLGELGVLVFIFYSEDGGTMKTAELLTVDAAAPGGRRLALLHEQVSAFAAEWQRRFPAAGVFVVEPTTIDMAYSVGVLQAVLADVLDAPVAIFASEAHSAVMAGQAAEVVEEDAE